jgi:activating signal cointegrator complex subunit 3
MIGALWSIKSISGHGVIITKQSKLYRYVSMLTSRVPIESQFISKINDNLNAEIVLGTVSNVDEAVEWLSHSYFYVRAQLNPLAYGIAYKSREASCVFILSDTLIMFVVQEDPLLFEYRHDLVKHAAMKLDQFQMIRYDDTNGVFHSTDLGRIASHYYVKTDTIELLNSGDAGVVFTSRMQDDQVLNLLSHAKEFDQLKVCAETFTPMMFTGTRRGCGRIERYQRRCVSSAGTWQYRCIVRQSKLSYSSTYCTIDHL